MPVARPGAVRAAADEEVEEELMMIEESAVSGAESAVSGAESAVSAALGAMERMEKTLDSVRGNFNTVRTGRASPSLLDRIELLLCLAGCSMCHVYPSHRHVYPSHRHVCPSHGLRYPQVEYYGASVILKSIAQIAAPDGSMLLVTPFDKSSIPSIEKAIMKSDVDLTPSQLDYEVRRGPHTHIPSIEKAIMKSDVGLTPSSDGNVIRLSIPQLTAERRKELLKTVSKLSEDGKVALRNVRRDSIKAYEKLQKEKKISEDALKDLSNDIQKMTDDYVKQIDTAFKQKEKDLLTV
ncbi:unnamed protein product [Closterium sp. NIES-64]|nr:unnamed protein product [Closterium sp. NIES-64]